MMSFGIEGADPEILAAMKKPITPHQSRQAVDLARSIGMNVAGHFILGLPGESEQTLQRTIDFACTLDLDIAQFYCAIPFPGSSLYPMALEEGWVEGTSFEKFRQDNAIMDLTGLEPSVVNRYRKRAYLRFYRNPRRLIRLLALLRIKGIHTVIKGGSLFYRWTKS